MHRLRTVPSLDVSAVAVHHAMPAALLLCGALRVKVNVRLFPVKIRTKLIGSLGPNICYILISEKKPLQGSPAGSLVHIPL